MEGWDEMMPREIVMGTTGQVSDRFFLRFSMQNSCHFLLILETQKVSTFTASSLSSLVSQLYLGQLSSVFSQNYII